MQSIRNQLRDIRDSHRMLNLRQQTVNVNRVELIEALSTGLQLHETAYNEALQDYRKAVVEFMDAAAARARAGDFADLRLNLHAPTYKGDEYRDMIDLLSVSVDETIQLDSEAYKAYYRNEWPWSRDFAASAMTYKSVLAAAGAAA